MGDVGRREVEQHVRNNATARKALTKAVVTVVATS